MKEHLARHSHFVSNTCLLKIRLASTIFIMVVLFKYLDMFGIQSFDYLTMWNWIILLIYFCLATISSYTNGRNKHIVAFQQSLFAILNPISWLVTTTFWIVLVGFFLSSAGKKSDFELIINSITHIFNLGFTLAELGLSKTELPWSSFLYPTILVIFYGLDIICVFFLYQKTWPYPFLDTVNGGQGKFIALNMALLLLAAIILMALLYSLTRFVIKIRDRRQKKILEINV